MKKRNKFTIIGLILIVTCMCFFPKVRASDETLPVHASRYARFPTIAIVKVKKVKSVSPFRLALFKSILSTLFQHPLDPYFAVLTKMAIVEIDKILRDKVNTLKRTEINNKLKLLYRKSWKNCNFIPGKRKIIISPGFLSATGKKLVPSCSYDCIIGKDDLVNCTYDSNNYVEKIRSGPYRPPVHETFKLDLFIKEVKMHDKDKK